MGVLDRVRRRLRGTVEAVAPVTVRRRTTRFVGRHTAEGELRALLQDDPNDPQAFAALAELVRASAAEGHEAERRRHGADDAVWALAEELAHSPRAWFPLVELARLSVDDDPDGAMRRLAIAVEREPTGLALTDSLAMLRARGKPEAALSLGVGHWRPKEQLPSVGRELVLAAVEAGRLAEARRHLEVLAEQTGAAGVADLRIDLDARTSQRQG